MAAPYHHAISSAKKWGGRPEDYQALHDWFDESKAFIANFRHRALRHHAEGIFECERQFGTFVTISTGREIPVRWIGEQHVKEDLGWIPTLADWLKNIKAEPWMTRRASNLDAVVKEFEDERASVLAGNSVGGSGGNSVGTVPAQRMAK